MTRGSILQRMNDGKLFRVMLLSHWSDIQADDGEPDRVKWYGSIGKHEAYVSASKGHTYELLPKEFDCE